MSSAALDHENRLAAISSILQALMHLPRWTVMRFEGVRPVGFASTVSRRRHISE